MKKIVIISLVLICLINNNIYSIEGNIQNIESNSLTKIQGNYIKLASIIINGNNNLISTSSTYNWSGLGTLTNPIKINNTLFQSLSISNTNLHMLIENCTFSGSQSNGLTLYNVSYLTISNSTFENNLNNGIKLSTVTNVTLQDSIFQNNLDGIVHDYLTNSTISNNIVQNNRNTGFLSSIEGDYLNWQDSIINNKFINNSFVSLQSYNQMSGNTIDNKVIQYSNKDNTVIQPLTNVGLLIALGTNVTITNFHLQYGLYYRGFNSTVKNNIINVTKKLPNSIGIYANSRNTVYTNNTILNSEYGLVLCRINSINNTIDENLIENSTSHYGIYFEFSGQHDNKIINNTLINNKLEFTLQNGGASGYYNLTGNIYANNTYNGKQIIFSLDQKDQIIDKQSIGELFLRDDENITIKNSQIDIAIIKDSNNITITNSTIQTSNKDPNSYYTDLAYYGYYINESVLQYGIILQNTSYVQINNNTFGKNLEDILLSHKTIDYNQQITNINITDNHFSQSNTSIMVKPVSKTDKIRVSNNTFDKTNYAIVIESKGNYTISKNYFSSNNHGIYQEIPSAINSNELNITVYRNVFLNNHFLFTTRINIIENDFINNNQYFTSYPYSIQQYNFFYPYLTTMVDSNYDNVSDNLCTTPDYINEYARTIPNIVKDIFLPQISLNIINNSIYNTNDIPISFSSSEKINILVSDNSEPWVGANNTIHLNDGLHKLRLKISDLSNNTISENISIRVDTKSPQLNFLGFPSNNSYINDSSLLYSYIGYDANGIANVEFYLNNVLQNDQNNTAIILTEGTYNLTLQAIDNTGNVTIIHSYFTVDHTAPLINIVMPNITNNGQIRIKYLANEQLSVENVSIDGIQVYSINNTLYTFNSGKHNMTIIAVDRAGNYATLTKNFIIDTNKPVINYHYDILNNNTIKLTFNATDENGISNFNVYLNSGHVNIGMNAPTIINLQNNVNNITIEAMDTANNTRIIILSFYSVSITTISLTSTTSLGNSSHTTPSARVTSISASTNVSYTGSINTTAGPELFVILCSLLILRMKKGKIKEYKK